MSVVIAKKGVGHDSTVYAPAETEKEKVAPVQPGDGTEDTEPEEKETPKKDTKKKK